MIGNKHTVDVLLENKLNVVCYIFPEHGFRGDADAGEHVSSSVDSKTGVPILSLYDGKAGKPSEESMRKVRRIASRYTRCGVTLLYVLYFYGKTHGCLCRIQSQDDHS